MMFLLDHRVRRRNRSRGGLSALNCTIRRWQRTYGY